MRSVYRRWSEHPYPGEIVPPKGSPEAGYQSMFFILRDRNNSFFDSFNQQINWNIKNPNAIDWNKELLIVQQTLKSLTPEQRNLALYWGTVDINKRLSFVIFSLIEKYRLDSPNSARVLANCHAAINDTFVITWYLKYLWDAARPSQYHLNLPIALTIPRFPGYPSAHAAVAGCTETVLSYFFPQEALALKKVAEDSARSRLYAGVHFKVDNDEGLRLGRQIGEIVVRFLRSRKDLSMGINM